MTRKSPSIVGEIRDHVDQVESEFLHRLDDQQQLLERMMTIIESHVERIERLEYHVLKLQPAPPMRSARRDH
jgi:hypothetical protein